MQTDRGVVTVPPQNALKMQSYRLVYEFGVGKRGSPEYKDDIGGVARKDSIYHGYIVPQPLSKAESKHNETNNWLLVTHEIKEYRGRRYKQEVRPFWLFIADNRRDDPDRMMDRWFITVYDTM